MQNHKPDPSTSAPRGCLCRECYDVPNLSPLLRKDANNSEKFSAVRWGSTFIGRHTLFSILGGRREEPHNLYRYLHRDS